MQALLSPSCMGTMVVAIASAVFLSSELNVWHSGSAWAKIGYVVGILIIASLPGISYDEGATKSRQELADRTDK